MPATALVPPSMGLSVNGYFNDADAQKAADLLALHCEREELSREELPSISLLFCSGERSYAVATAIQQQIEPRSESSESRSSGKEDVL